MDAGDNGEAAFGLEQVRAPGEGPRLHIRGDLRLRDAGRFWRELHEVARDLRAGDAVHVDLSGVQQVDASALAILTHVRRELAGRDVHTTIEGGSPEVRALEALFEEDRGEPLVPRKRVGFLEQVGTATRALVYELKLVLAFLGQTIAAAVAVVREPRSVHWKDLFPTMEKAGADGVPIVLTINFLVGLVMAFQASRQLERFGANILVADLIGISVTRELGPLMTAIVVSGRSGAAFAAELGAMKVNEEIDALRTMGFSPLRFLVFPKVIALVLVMPLLTVLADIVGIAGGLVVGTVNLDLGIVGYLQQTSRAVTRWDVGSGLIKSAVFGLVITQIACQQGLSAQGSAAEVGRRTTSSVVVTLFSLILIDSGFTVFFRMVGL